MANASIYVSRVSSSCFLLLWEALQDQQVGLTQAPGACEFSMHLYFPKPSGSAQSKPCWPSNSGVLGAHLPHTGPLGWGVQREAQTPHSLGRTPAAVLILHLWIIRGDGS